MEEMQLIRGSTLQYSPLISPRLHQIQNEQKKFYNLLTQEGETPEGSYCSKQLNDQRCEF